MKISRLLLALFFPAAASLLGSDELKERLQPALEAITPDGLLAHIKVLASDEFEGRAPGSKGEELSVKYITDQFEKIGLKPGNPDGTYTQEVPLAGIKSEPQMSFVIGDKTMSLKDQDDFVASFATPLRFSSARFPRGYPSRAPRERSYQQTPSAWCTVGGPTRRQRTNH